MITKTANLFMAKEAGLGSDIIFKAKQLAGQDDLGDRVKYRGGQVLDAASNAGEKVSNAAKKLLALGHRNLAKNVVNTIAGGHDGSVSDKAKMLLSDLSDKIGHGYRSAKESLSNLVR